MAYEIYTFGNGEILKGVFDAIAMCLNSHTGSLFEPLKKLGLIIGVFWAALYAIYKDQITVFTNWIIPMTLIMNLLFVPTTSVWIHDPVTNYHQKVDHVPYGLAAFAGYVSKIGYILTSQIEKVFSLPDDLKYQKSGCLFASNIIQQAKSFRIINEDLNENMKSFVGQCVVFTAMIGNKYTIEELRHSDNLWGLISSNASPVRSFVWRNIKNEQGVRARPEIITCKQGVERFNQLWGPELDRTANLFGKKIFGTHGLINPKIEFLKYLPLAYETLGNLSKSATDLLKQQMMIYAIVDGVESNSTALGNTPNFAARRAYLQQRSTYETLGTMAGETLPAMKAVLEEIAYACFLFVIPLSLLPFGWKFLMRWGQILLWLQMWAPLYAILNYIMTLSAKLKTVGALSLSNIEGVTIASSVGIYNLNCDIASQAGYLAMSIPFLCIALVKGVGSFVTMASHLGGVGQSAAGIAAGEITTGNFSFGNISEGNQQIANTNMLSQSRTASYKAGSFNMQDGRTDVTSFGDGSKTINVGNSNLPISLNMADSLQSQQSEMASKAQQKAFNLSTSAGKSLSSSLRDTMDLSERLSSNEHFADGTQSNVNSEQTRSISKVSQIIQDFAKSHGIEDKKAAEIIGNASAGLGLGKNSISIGGSSQMNASQTQQYSDAQKLVESQDFQEAFRQVSNESKNLSYTLSDDQSKSLAENISDSYESGITQRSEALKSFNESESWSKQAMFTQSNSATINANKTQEFVDWLANQPADNTHGNLGYQAASHIIANNPKEAMEYMNRFATQQESLHHSVQNEIDQSKSNLRENYDSKSRVLDNDFQETEKAGVVQPYQTNTSQISPPKDYPLSKNEPYDMPYMGDKNHEPRVTNQELPHKDDKSHGTKFQEQGQLNEPDSSYSSMSQSSPYSQSNENLSSPNHNQNHESSNDKKKISHDKQLFNNQDAFYENSKNISLVLTHHSNLAKQGEDFKAQVNDKIDLQSRHINEQESHITQETKKIQEQVKTEQSKGIHNRLAQKGIKEINETSNDIKKMLKGESQQK